jgi:unconventional prefoldin RPB5 interactor 1
MTYLRKLLGPGTPLATKSGEELKSSSSQNTKNLAQQKVKEPNKKNGKILPLAPDPNFALSKDSITAPNTELKIEGDKSEKEPFSAIIPSDETAEDAALRRQMIQYNMEDVGAIVAEIDLDEGDSSVLTDEDDSDAWTDEEELDDSSAEEEEDQYGRTKRRVVSEKYRQEMLALEEKLNAQSIKNVGPEENLFALSRKDVEDDQTEGRMINRDEISPAQKTSPTKEVRFATEVQIQDAACDKDVLAALTDTQINPPQDCPPAKKATISRFKAERTSSPSSTTPKPPDGIFASSILERPYNQKVSTSSPAPTKPLNAIASDIIVERPYEPALPSSPAPPSSDDPALVQQQLAAEYHRLRNRMIYRQGGFLADDEEEQEEEETVVDVNVDRDGGRAEPSRQEDASRLEQQAGKKISRFRAARLKGIGGAIR